MMYEAKLSVTRKCQNLRNISIIGRNIANNYAPFTKCITKIDETIIDNAEDLDLVISMYNLVEFS